MWVLFWQGEIKPLFRPTLGTLAILSAAGSNAKYHRFAEHGTSGDWGDEGCVLPVAVQGHSGTEPSVRPADRVTFPGPWAGSCEGHICNIRPDGRRHCCRHPGV